MRPEIGVLIGQDGATGSIEGGCQLSVYQKNAGQWREVRSREIVIDTSQGLRGFRRLMTAIVDFLGTCRIVVGLAITGVPYYELEKAQCSIWELNGRPSEFLEDVLVHEEENQRQLEVDVDQSVMPQLIDLGNGDYRISLKEIQEKGNGITSKQVLMPILQRGEFTKLEISCNHVPPWIECELVGGSLTGEIKKHGPKEVTLTIFNVPHVPIS